MKGLYFITDKGIKSHEDKSIKNTRQLILKYYDMQQPETYHLINERLQCNYGRSRSFIDLYKLCVSRFPRTTKNIVARVVINLCKQDLLKCQYCNTVGNCVFHRLENNWTYISNKKFNVYSVSGNNYSINIIYNLSNSK